MMFPNDKDVFAQIASSTGLKQEVLEIVAQAICFSDEQRASLDAEAQSKVELMVRGEHFAQYRAAIAHAIPTVAARAKVVQDAREAKSNAAKKAAAPKAAVKTAKGAGAVKGGFLNKPQKKAPAKALLPSAAPARAQPATASNDAAVSAAAAALGVDAAMLRAVAQAMAMSTYQIDCIPDDEAREKMQGVRSNDAFAQVRAACHSLGLVKESQAVNDAALAADGGIDAEDSKLDDSQISAAAQALRLSDREVDALDPDAQRAVRALRTDPAFAGVRKMVERRSKTAEAPKPAPTKPDAPLRPKNTPWRDAPAAKEAQPASEAAPAKAKEAPAKKAARATKVEAAVKPVDDFARVAISTDGGDDGDGDGDWSDPVAAEDDWSDPVVDGDWSDAVASAGNDAAGATPVPAAPAADLDDVIEDDEEGVIFGALPPLDHAMRRRDDGERELVVHLPPGARCESLDVDFDRVRVSAPGAATLDLALRDPHVDAKQARAKYSKKHSTLTITLPPAPPGFVAPAAPAVVAAPEHVDDGSHAAFMENLGREAKHRGYMPPMQAMDEYKEDA